MDRYCTGCEHITDKGYCIKLCDKVQKEKQSGEYVRIVSCIIDGWKFNANPK